MAVTVLATSQTGLAAPDVPPELTMATRKLWRDLLDCVKTRQRPFRDIEVAHRTVTVCHLGNIAVRTGKKVQWDPAKEQIIGDAELAKWATKAYRAPWKLPAA